jgi:hypothetical protein
VVEEVVAVVVLLFALATLTLALFALLLVQLVGKWRE